MGGDGGLLPVMFAVSAIKSSFPCCVISHMNSRDKVGERREKKNRDLGLGGIKGGVNKQNDLPPEPQCHCSCSANCY